MYFVQISDWFNENQYKTPRGKVFTQSHAWGIHTQKKRNILRFSRENNIQVVNIGSAMCMDVFNDAVERYGKPEIINSDQSSQYTSNLWTKTIEGQQIKISMNGKGRVTDNIWIERF